MEQINCINFCDIMNYLDQDKETIDAVITRIAHKANIENIQRIYIGSYFCAQYFLHMKDEIVEEVVQYAKKKEVKITIVSPIIPQKDLEDVLKKIEGATTPGPGEQRNQRVRVAEQRWLAGCVKVYR